MDIDIIKICSKKDFLYFLCKLKEDYCSHSLILVVHPAYLTDSL